MFTKTNFCVLALAGAAILGVSLTTQKAQALPVDQVAAAIQANATAKPPSGMRSSYKSGSSSSYSHYNSYSHYSSYRTYNSYSHYNNYRTYTSYGWYNSYYRPFNTTSYRTYNSYGWYGGYRSMGQQGGMQGGQQGQQGQGGGDMEMCHGK